MTATDRDLAAVIERARRYPFEQPAGSYLFRHGYPAPLTLDEIAAGNFTDTKATGRVPVFGYSSNSSPDALAVKFAALPEVEIPVIRCRIPDFDVVYSSHISAGYVPGVIHPSPGTTLNGYLTCLTAEELALMNLSERLGTNYELAPLAEAAGRLETGEEIEAPLAYLGLHGHLTVEGSPVAVTGTRVDGRTFNEWPEARMLEMVRSLLTPELGLDEFAAITVTDLERRDRLTAQLKQSEIGSG